MPPASGSTLAKERASQRPPAMPSSSSSSVNTTSSSSNTPNVPMSAEALIAHNGASLDPKYAALEQAVNERNTLSSQNGQLWKLIEKQRSGYNQILKELERVRNERDSYRAKLVARVKSPEKGDISPVDSRTSRSRSDEQRACHS